MNKTILGVAMVVVFCITWWLVAGEAMQIAQQALQAVKPAQQAANQAAQAAQQAQQAAQQAEQADIMAAAHWRTQAVCRAEPSSGAHGCRA